MFQTKVILFLEVIFFFFQMMTMRLGPLVTMTTTTMRMMRMTRSMRRTALKGTRTRWACPT